MATQRWTGNAPAVAQVNTLTPAAVASGNSCTVTINGKSVTYVSAAGTVADVVAGLAAALQAAALPEFKEVTWAANGTTSLTGTAVTAGKPFTQTSSATGGATLTTQAGVGSPANAAFGTSTIGGTLAAGTYYYRVTAYNAAGESLPSAETSQTTTGSTSTVTVNWTAAAGNVAGYKVYGRTTGAEQLLAVLGNVLTWTDTGALTPAGALPTANTSASSGPNDLAMPANWSAGSLPQAGDDLYFEGTVPDCLYNLTALAGITFNSLNVNANFTGKIGLPAWNGSYFEYRPLYLKAAGTTTQVGYGAGSGSGLLKIDAQAVAVTLLVFTTSTQALEQGGQPLRWLGTNAANVVEVTRGTVGLAAAPGEAATVATLNVGYQANVAGDATVFAGSGLTLTTLNQSGGAVTLNSGCTTVAKSDGLLTVFGTGAVTTLTVDGGTLRHNGTGTITTLNVGNGGAVNAGGDMRAANVTNCTLYKGATLSDPFGRLVFGSALLLARCRAGDVTLDVGENRHLAVS